MRKTKQMGLRRLGHIPPPRLSPDIEQRCIVVDPDFPLDMQLPKRCPKCGADGAMLRRQGWLVNHPGVLGGCGWDSVLVSRGSLASV